MKTKCCILLCLLIRCLPVFSQDPKADFFTEQSKSCVPAIISFRDNSTGNPTSYQWDFGNGGTSTQKDPTTTYLEPGNYSIRLIVSRDSTIVRDSTLADTVITLADTLVREAYIQVTRNPKIAFSSTQVSGCSPVRVQFFHSSFADSSNTLANWEWDFGDGEKGFGPKPQHVYRQEGSYAVTLKVTDDLGCSSVMLKPKFITVSGGILPDFTSSDPPVCGAPAPITFTNKSTGPGTLTYRWNFGDGGTSRATNPVHNYLRNDTFSVSLVVSSSEGCIDTLFRPASVLIGFYNTSFFLEGFACPGQPAQLVNNSKPIPNSAKWTFPDGTVINELNPRKVFTAPGTYPVELINIYGNCADTLVQNITISAPPVVDFSTANTAKCQPNLVSRFQNNTRAASFSWEFGDNNFSTEANPTHTYTNFGNYNVTLRATSAEGCIASLTKPAYIRIQQPEVILKNEKMGGCIPYEYKPELTIASVENISSIVWDFGDGQQGTGLAPTHVYANQGTYNLTITVTTASGCGITKNYAEAVRSGTKPKANFTAAPLVSCASAAIVFDNLSEGANSYLWQFGDGGTSELKTPTYEYSDTGTMDVQLIAFNNGCADSLLRQAYLYIKPSISAFAYQPDCGQPLRFTFTDQSIGAKTWEWDFGDGTRHQGQKPPVHIFPENGTYNVSLTTTNGSCTHTTTRSITIGPLKIDFDADPKIACKPVNINLKPSGSELGAVARLTWQFTSGAISMENISGRDGTTVTFDKAGDYDVRLITIDTFGCRRDSITKLKLLRINGPTADFSSPNNLTCTGSTVDFNDSSRNDGVNNIVQWEWAFGTGAPPQNFTAPPFSFKYDSTGSFNVRLKVTDAAGCTDVNFKSLFVQTSTIKAEWDAPRFTCPGAPVGFSNTTKANVFNAVWRFGDGDTSAALAPQHSYRDTGNFSVTLVVTNPVGCTDSLTRPAYIYSGLPRADFDGLNFLTYCIPYEARFFNRSYYSSAVYWDLSQGISRQENPIAYYTEKGDYNINLKVTSPGGCVDSITKVLTVREPSEGLLQYRQVKECYPVRVDFTAFDSLQGRFVWDFGNGNVVDTNTNRIAHTYNGFGNFIPKVILYEPTGCILSLSGRETIQALGVKARFSINQNLFCDLGNLLITDSSTTNDNRIIYAWDFGDGSPISDEVQPRHLYNKIGTFKISLATVTNTGCVDSASTIIKVSETPRIDISGDTVFCAGEREVYNGLLQNPNQDSLRWQWVLPGGESTTVRNPGQMIFKDTGSFSMQVIATNPDGCADTSFRNIRVHPQPVVTTPPPITIMAGQKIVFPVQYSSGISRYYWSPAQTLSCGDCPFPEAIPKVDTRYTINVLDSNGCRTQGEVQVFVMCTNANVFAPNTFSPNGDGRNDVFYLRGTGLERGRLLRVFNRWGEVVFEKREFAINEASVGWDGRFKGNTPHPEVYVYQAEVYCTTGEILKFEGNVALIQ